MPGPAAPAAPERSAPAAAGQPAAASPPPRTGDDRRTLRSGSDDGPLMRLYDVALTDLDGVVYLGGDVIDGAPAAIRRARDGGLRLAYVTNNASRQPAEVAELLTQMGVAAGPEDVVTSAQAAAHLLAQRLPAGSAVLVVGAAALAEAVAGRGLRPVRSAADDPVAVVQGFDRAVGWTQLAEAAVALRNGALWVATNADTTLPSRRGPLPGNGALLAVLRTATGREPVVVGKPEVQLHADAVARTGAQRPLVVGDRLDTDILGAARGGADSLLVLTGITGPAELLTAARDCRPTYVGADLTALCTVHPAVQVGHEAVACRSFRVMVGADQMLELEPAGRAAGGDPLDALRALCVAWWQAQDRGAAPAGSSPSVRASGSARTAAQSLGLRPV